MSDIIIIDPLKDFGWKDYISARPESTIFHHPVWLSLLHEQYGYNVFALCAVDEKGTINAGIPFCSIRSINGKEKWISLPFSDTCYPLYEKEHDIQEILKYLIIRNEQGQLDSIEIRSGISFQDSFLTLQENVIHILNLTDSIEDIFSKFHEMQKRGIKKAQKGNLSAEILNNKQGIDSYYQLHLLTRKKQGVPIQPKSFFNRLLKEIIERNYGTIIIVKYGNIAIAGGVFLWYGNTFTYKYGASDPKYLYLRPNNLLFWEAIQLASRMSFCYFDFGKTEIQNEGLRSFKSGWGSKETPLYYSYFPVMLKSGIFSFLKDKVVGPIIRHSPTFVCKWSGELLYKYFP